MAVFHLLSLLLLTGCRGGPSVHTHGHGLDLSTAERVQLEQLAAGGDGAAARKLYHYYAMELHDKAAGDLWLRRAAALKDPEAQGTLAYLIKEYNHSPRGFGANAPAAVLSLLEQASRTEGDACYELASAYAKGYFGSPNPTKARLYFQRGAELNNRMCWTKLSHYYRQGLGGPRDDVEAYYWISLEARCVDPRSMSGEEVWRIREEVASHLTPAILEAQWKRVDLFISEVNAGRIQVDFAPFLSGMIDPKLEAEGRRYSQRKEAGHRREYRSQRGGEHGG